MKKRFVAVGLTAALALGGGAVACANAEQEVDRIQDEADQIIEEGGQKLDELQEDIQNGNS